MENFSFKPELKALKSSGKSLTDLASQFFITDSSGSTAPHLSSRRSKKILVSPRMYLNVIDDSNKQLVPISDSTKQYIESIRPMTASFKKSVSRKIFHSKSLVFENNNLLMASKRLSNDHIGRYLLSLRSLKNIKTDLEVNFLLANSNNQDSKCSDYLNIKLLKDVENLIAEKLDLTHEMDRVMFIQKLKEHLSNFREIFKDIKDHKHINNIEILFRILIKLFDNAFTVHDYHISKLEEQQKYICKNIIEKYHNELAILQKNTEKKFENSFEKEAGLLKQLEALQHEIHDLNCAIQEKDKIIGKFSEFDTREYTMLRMEKMIKGIGNFISETEEEYENQSKTLRNVSYLIQANENWSSRIKSAEIGTQTYWSLPHTTIEFPEYDFPLISENKLTVIAQKNKFKIGKIKKECAQNLCELI